MVRNSLRDLLPVIEQMLSILRSHFHLLRYTFGVGLKRFRDGAGAYQLSDPVRISALCSGDDP